MPFGDVFKRMGKTRTKVTFFIEVQTLVITPISGLDSGDDLNVLFERGDKSVSSAPKTLTESRKDKNLTADFSEILRLDATMYKDSHGVFQEKVGKLTVRQRKTGTAGLKAGKDAFKAIGVAPLQLHTFVNNGDAHQQLCLPLLWCMADNATLTVTISTRISESAQNSEADSDDNSSITSTQSLSGTGGSSISATNRPPSNASTTRLTSTINSKPVVPPIASKLTPQTPPASKGVPVPPVEESSPVSWAARKGSKTTKTTSVPPSEDGSDDGPRPSTGSFKTNIGTRGASFTVDDWQPDFNGSEATGSVRGHDDDHGEESDQFDDTSISKTNRYGSKNGTKTASSGGMILKLKQSEEEIQRLHEEINELKDENSMLKTKVASATQSTPYSTNNSPIKSSETDALKTKVQTLTDQLRETEKFLHETRAEKDDKSTDNTKYLKEILDLKMTAVPLIKDVEYWKTTCSELKLNLQAYASRLTAMEVQLAEAEVAHAGGGWSPTHGLNHDQPLPSQRPISMTLQPPPLKLQQKTPQVIAQSQQMRTPPPAPVAITPPSRSFQREREREREREIESSPVAVSAPAATNNKFSNFVNSTKNTVSKIQEPTGYGGKKAPVSHYSSVDLS